MWITPFPTCQGYKHPLAAHPHCCQVVARFVRLSHRKIPQFGEKFRYFSGSSYLCDKIGCFHVIPLNIQFDIIACNPPLIWRLLNYFLLLTIFVLFQYKYTSKIYTATFPLFPLKFRSNFSP
jgi:hypothetical protein